MMSQSTSRFRTLVQCKYCGHLAFFILVALSAGSHLLSLYAPKLIETFVLAPVVDIELLGSVVVDYLLFAEVPTASLWIGASLIL